MRGKAKQREMQALRAAGLTLAGADRLTQTRKGSALMLFGIGGTAIALMAGVGVLSMNLPAADSAPEVTASVTPDATLPQPDPVASAQEPTPIPQAPEPSVDLAISEELETVSTDVLPWLAALQDAETQSSEAKPALAAVEVEQDCVLALAAEASRVLVQFDEGSATVPPESYDMLVAIGAMANACPEARVQVAGHSDSSGSDLANLQLSWSRAENTIETFSVLGIDTSQFETVGFGSRAPLEQGSSSDDSINRRVELRVLKGETN